MHGAGGEENRHGNERTTAMFEGLLASRLVLPFASVLSPYSLLAFFFWVSPLQSSCLSLSTGFLHFLLPCFADFIWKKKKAKTERQSLLVYGFSFFLRFLPFFSSSSVPFSVFSFPPSLVTEMDEDNGTAASAHSRWSLFLGTLKTMATPVHCSFSFLLLMLSMEMMRETAMKTCYAGWVHAPASVFFCFWQWRSAFFFSFVPLLSFSAWLHISLFFCNFVPVKTFTIEKMNPCSLPLFSFFFLSFSALSLPPLARSLEGFIYSLEYLYLGKI